MVSPFFPPHGCPHDRTSPRHRRDLVERRSIACDTLLMCGGWTPSVHLFSQSRDNFGSTRRPAEFLPDHGHRLSSAGGCNGTFPLAACLEEGYAAGQDIAMKPHGLGLNGTAPTRRLVSVDSQMPTGGKAFVDFQNDVTTRSAAAVREGFNSIEHVKRYTTTGMATDQGKTRT